MKITILSIGKIKNKNILSLIKEYEKRLGIYVKLKIVELPPYAFSANSQEKAKKEEGRKVISFLKKQYQTHVFLLTESGQEYSSKKFSNIIKNQEKLVFVVCGVLGPSQELLNYCQNTLSLSRLTFPHELARLILLEQVYRAWTIIKKKKYHY